VLLYATADHVIVTNEAFSGVATISVTNSGKCLCPFTCYTPYDKHVLLRDWI